MPRDAQIEYLLSGDNFDRFNEVTAALLQAQVDRGEIILCGSSLAAADCPPELINTLRMNPQQYRGSIFYGSDTHVGGTLEFDACVFSGTITGSGVLTGTVFVDTLPTPQEAPLQAPNSDAETDTQPVLQRDEQTRDVRIDGTSIGYLTPNEFSILQLILARQSTKPIDAQGISLELGIPAHSVDSHLVKIRRALKTAGISIQRGYSVYQTMSEED